jgi:hypothetical protein
MICGWRIPTMDANSDFAARIYLAKIQVKEAETDLLRAKECLRGLEVEASRSKSKKVSEGSTDTRTLLKG